MRISQIAVSVTDLRRTQRWYRDVLGLTPAGGTNLFAIGPLPARVQGLPRASSTCWWLLDGQEDFQLELFEFRRPKARPQPAGWRPCDIGYSMISLYVEDFDAVLARAEPVGPVIGERGARRACVRDPEGVLIELMEDDPPTPGGRGRRAADVPVVRSVTLSVPDLERACKTFGDALGLVPATDVELHRPEHEALWGLQGAKRREALYWADDILVEIVHYDDPVGRPWPDGYRISDQGLLNIAFGFRADRDMRTTADRCIAAGLRPNCKPMALPGLASGVYVNDPDGFSIELMAIRPRARGLLGFQPRRTPRFSPFLSRRAPEPS